MDRLTKLAARRTDEAFALKASMQAEAFRSLQESDAVRYAIGAMQKIDPEYTQNTFDQGDRVKNQLNEKLSIRCDFEYQGSVTTDTHIKARSDIDLLVIHPDWIWIEPPQVSESPYRGDTSEEMRRLRRGAVAGLESAFPKAQVDNDGARSVKISGGSLTREVDIVPSTWFNTNDYVRTGDKKYRGVKVFDYENGTFVANTPFLNNYRINERDLLTRGGLRKAARLMKSLKYDSDNRASMSSYNIVGIAYNIPLVELNLPPQNALGILDACCGFCHRLVEDETLRSTIVVPDGHRSVFGQSPGADSQQLRALTQELSQLRQDVLSENWGSIRKLAEHRLTVSAGQPIFFG